MVEDSQSTIATINKIRNDYNLLQIRLDTSDIISQAKMFLNAEIEMVVQDESGQFKRDVISIGDAKANKHGIASILNWMQMIINPQVVQGNFPMDNKGKSTMYDQYIYECQVDLMDMLMINLEAYGIKEDEIQSIVDSMMNLIKPFMTRLIGNEERRSYGESFKEVRSDSIRDSRKVPLLNN